MRVAIIGGSGEMGRWFARFLQEEGKEVVITGRNEEKLREAGQQLGVEVTMDNVAAVKSAGIVMISVPVDNFEAVVKQVAPYIAPKQLILDVTSIKLFPMETMHHYLKSGLVLGTHPVFGPGASGVSGQNFVLTPTSENERVLANKARKYLEARGAKVALMTPREHDEMMAVILGLAHFIAIVSADTLLNFDNLRQMEASGGITYKVLLTLVESVTSEDPELYASLQMSLPNMVKIEDLFRERGKMWADLVRNKDRQQFVKKMSALRRRFEQASPDFSKAYGNMYKIVEGL